MRGLLVIEANEIPLSILQWYAAEWPRSTISDLLRQAQVTESIVEEHAGRELYPSQTWATFATGVPYDKHGVYWYGDPKPEEFPLYWQAAAAQVSVGLVGVLHSSPWAANRSLPGVRFALPDAFAADGGAYPRSLEPLQRFNLAMTSRNARAVAAAQPAGDILRGGRALAHRRIRPQTCASLARLVGAVVAGRASRERLRTAQFLVFGDVFERLMHDYEPDLGVVFTNHVAAAMHRYWPASFPKDWAEPPYGEEWVKRYRREIPDALHTLDRFLRRQLDFCRRTDRTLLMVSSMGQDGGRPVDRGGDRVLIVQDPVAFARGLGVAAAFETLNAMVPHVSIRLESDERAAAEWERLAKIAIDGERLVVDRAGDTVTITYQLANAGPVLRIDGSDVDPESVGLAWRKVDEHKAGRHTPRGIVLVANSPTATVPKEPVALEELAPAILSSLGVEPLDHHRAPTLRL